MVRVASITPAKNEEKYIGKCISALKKQRKKIDFILVIDDNSQDSTYNIAKKFEAHEVLRLKGSKERLTGTPHIAKVINFGLEYLKNFGEFDYLLILGADHILPENYLEFLTNRMERNKKIAIASGRILKERYYPDFPRGSGSLIRYSFWKPLGLKYPLTYGWESYLVYKAKQLGFLTLCYPQIYSFTLRPTYSLTKLQYIGMSMKALGYPLEYALGRTALTFFRNPKGALSLLSGYLKDVEKTDVSIFVKNYLRRRSLKRIIRYLKLK